MKRYKAYKDSGIEWIGEIPAGWKTVRMGASCYLKGRIGWQGLKAEEFIDDGPYLVTGTDFCNGRVNWKTCYHISQDRFEEAPEIHVRNGDLLITKDGTIGKLALICDAPNAVSLNSHLLLMRPLDDQIDSRFLFWVLSGEEFSHYTDISQSGTIMASLSQDKIARFIYALPSVVEQQAIVDYLNVKTAEIDGLVADCEREVELLQEYRKAVISEAVTKGLDPNAAMKDSGVEWIGEIPEGWHCLPLKHLTISIASGTSLEGASWPAGEEEKGVLTLSSVYQGKFDAGQNKAVLESLYDRLSCPLVVGSLLISRCNTSEWVGTAAYVDKAPENLYLPDKLWQLRFEDDSVCRYIQYSLQSSAARNHFVALSVGASSTMQNVAKSDLLATPIALPKHDEIAIIVSYLDAKTVEIDSLIDSKRQMIEKLREYRKSLISEAVTGKFKVPGV